jgi:2'-5' RNA ligase
MSDDPSYIGFKAWGFGFDAHLTMVWTNKLDANQVREISQILRNSVSPSYFSLAKRLDFAMFGPDQDIPVLLVDPHEEIHVLREVLVEHPNIPNPSEYPWNPHITLKLVPRQPLVIPPIIKLSHLDVY